MISQAHDKILWQLVGVTKRTRLEWMICKVVQKMEKRNDDCNCFPNISCYAHALTMEDTSRTCERPACNVDFARILYWKI